MAKDQTGFAKLIGDGLNPKTLEFIKNIKQSLDQPVTDGPPVQPADRFSAPLAKYKNALPAIQQDLEALSSALALWLGTQDEAKTNTPKSTGKGAPAALDAAGAASKAARLRCWHCASESRPPACQGPEQKPAYGRCPARRRRR